MKRIALLAFAGLVLVAVRALPAPVSPPDADKEGTVAGIAIDRAQGGWLGLEIKGGSFQITFYNEKKKPVPADATSAVLRWSVHYQPNPERTELTPAGDPAVLASSYPVKPPHSFILHVTLLFDGKPDASESYTVNYSE
jgi:hypothetical protein